jgi:type IV pilus assembly protein PilW
MKHMQINRRTFRLQQGFTLVELMVALTLTFVVSAAAYSAYKVQRQNAAIQEDITVLQQNIRAGLDLMALELRMAGYDPTSSGKYGIVAADAGSLRFTADLCEDGGNPGTCVVNGESVTETYLYELYDSTGDGVNDALRRTPGGSAIADNIEHLEFYYTLRDGTETLAPTNSELGRIVSVRVSILARSSRPDHKYTDSNTYRTASETVINPAERNYHRRMLTTTLQLRNLGYGG